MSQSCLTLYFFVLTTYFNNNLLNIKAVSGFILELKKNMVLFFKMHGVTQQVKCLLPCRHHIWPPVCIMAASIPIQLPSKSLDKSAKDTQSPSTTTSLEGDLGEVIDSWIPIGSILTIAGSDKANQWRKVQCFFLSLYNSDFEIN